MECRICGSHLEVKGAVSCARCNAAFHRDCWLFNGKCAIYACGCKTYVGYRPAETALVEIDEATRVPQKGSPRLEALVKRLPVWGRLLIPSVLPGLVAAALVVFLYPALTAIRPDMFLMGHLALCGILPGFLAPPLGRTMRRSPMAVFRWATAATVAFYVLGRPLGAAFGVFRTTLITLAVVAGTVAANALVERATAEYRFAKPPWPLLMLFLRPVFTGVGLIAMLIALTAIFGPHPLVQFLPEVLVVGLFGLFVASPPMELSKSATYRRLIAQSIRGEGADADDPDDAEKGQA